MPSLSSEQAAAISTSHVVHGVDASGVYLGLVPRGTPAAVAPCAPPAVGTWLLVDGRWVRQSTLADLIAERVAAVDADLADIERRQARPVGDIMAAIATGATPSQDDITRLTELRAYAAAARAARAAMAAASTEAEVAAVVWPQEAP